MEGAQELRVIVQAATEANPTDNEERNTANNEDSSALRSRKNYKMWLQVFIYTLFLLSGQAVAVLLGRLYYDNGGHSKWTATLVQLIGFPILFPYYFFSPAKEPAVTSEREVKPPSPVAVRSIYILFGFLIAATSYVYQIGLQYLPVSTYSLISSSQLAFTAFFSYFLNSQKFTPFVVNSLLLLTISSTLLVFNKESQNPAKVSKEKFTLGFLCTVGASALSGFSLSLTQLAIRKVIKTQSFSVIVELIICQSLVSSCALLIGVFASGEWKGLTVEMENYKPGKVSYLMTLIWIAICSQVAAIGAVGLIFEVSSLFSNAIGALSLPIVQVLAVIVFHDKMDGLKVIAVILAIWGFISYVYQQYLDERAVPKASTSPRHAN